MLSRLSSPSLLLEYSCYENKIISSLITLNVKIYQNRNHSHKEFLKSAYRIIVGM